MGAGATEIFTMPVGVAKECVAVGIWSTRVSGGRVFVLENRNGKRRSHAGRMRERCCAPNWNSLKSSSWVSGASLASWVTGYLMPNGAGAGEVVSASGVEHFGGELGQCLTANDASRRVALKGKLGERIVKGLLPSPVERGISVHCLGPRTAWLLVLRNKIQVESVEVLVDNEVYDCAAGSVVVAADVYLHDRQLETVVDLA